MTLQRDHEPVVVGLDVGGTKVAVRVESLDGGRVLDAERPATGWEAEPAGAAADWIVDKVRRSVPPSAVVGAVGVGGQGCNTSAIAVGIERALERRGVRAHVVNDAALLVPAAGLESGFGVVAGTGAIAVGATEAGEPMSAGGWGWVLGDDAGAAGIVREASRAVLAAADDGVALDALGHALLEAFDVSDTEHLARAVNDDPRVEQWAPHARAVFGAANAGSALAVNVIDHAARHLAGLVSSLVRRGCAGRTAVAAGGVIRSQPRLADSLRNCLAALDPAVSLVLLDDAPVGGAVTLARRLGPLPGG